jgi:hypothetical protein
VEIGQLDNLLRSQRLATTRQESTPRRSSSGTHGTRSRLVPILGAPHDRHDGQHYRHLNRRDKGGETPLGRALWENTPEIAALLRSLGAKE